MRFLFRELGFAHLVWLVFFMVLLVFTGAHTPPPKEAGSLAHADWNAIPAPLLVLATALSIFGFQGISSAVHGVTRTRFGMTVSLFVVLGSFIGVRALKDGAGPVVLLHWAIALLLSGLSVCAAQKFAACQRVSRIKTAGFQAAQFALAIYVMWRVV